MIFFILAGSLTLNITEGVKTLGFPRLLTLMDNQTSEIHR